MAYINIDIEDYLDEIDTPVLEKEIKSRGIDIPKVSEKSEVRDLLNQSADELRKINKNNLSLRLDDLRGELEL